MGQISGVRSDTVDSVAKTIAVVVQMKRLIRRITVVIVATNTHDN